MNEIGALDTISNALAQLFPQRLYGFEGSGLALFKLDGGIPQRLIAQGVQYLSNILSALRKQRNIIHFGVCRGGFNGDRKGAVISVFQRIKQAIAAQAVQRIFTALFRC